MQQKCNTKATKRKLTYTSLIFLTRSTKIAGVLWIVLKLLMLFVNIEWLRAIETGLGVLLVVNFMLFIEESRNRFAIIGNFMHDLSGFLRDLAKELDNK